MFLANAFPAVLVCKIYLALKADIVITESGHSVRNTVLDDDDGYQMCSLKKNDVVMCNLLPSQYEILRAPYFVFPKTHNHNLLKN